LVKDYKLCTTYKNDPVRDAELAYTLFLDQMDALRKRHEDHPEDMLCFHCLFAQENGKGLANFFATMRHALRPSLIEIEDAWKKSNSNQSLPQYLENDCRKIFA
jgi:ATP-dependent DNA helicase RecQ